MDKARIIRVVKSAEIAIMVFGAGGLILHNIPLLLAALFAMGVHSSFFGPIKYAVLPQHLKHDEVLGGTGLVEAGTYGAILLGTIAGGLLGREHGEIAAAGVLIVAVIGRVIGGMVPPLRPNPTRRRSSSTGTSFGRRSGWSMRHCISRACSWRSSRSAFSGRWAPSWPRNSRRSSRTCSHSQ
jgi:MFS family permease